MAKTCGKCKEVKSQADFALHSHTKDRLRTWCRECMNAYSKMRRSAAGYQKKYDLKKYGLTLEQFNAMRGEQGHKCKICQTHEDHMLWNILYVDHDHVSGKVRGLLCSDCNKALGTFKDDPDLLESAKQYLLESRGK